MSDDVVNWQSFLTRVEDVADRLDRCNEGFKLDESTEGGESEIRVGAVSDDRVCDICYVTLCDNPSSGDTDAYFVYDEEDVDKYLRELEEDNVLVMMTGGTSL